MPHERLRPEYHFDQDRIDALHEIAPEAFVDGKINWATLKEALGLQIEDDQADAEHFGLFWPGKREARRLASIPSTGTLVPMKGEGIDEESTGNIFIEGENLEVLRILRKSYAGRIKMIYIDPPYNTGNDFVYDDDFTEPLQDYLRRTSQIDGEGRPMTTNKKSDGRFHSRWLSMMYPRLRLARELLRDDGVIFVSIGDEEVHNLRSLLGEVFGEENFLGTAVRVSKKANNQGDYWAPNFDSLLSFGKNRQELPSFFGGINFASYKLIEESGPRKGERYQLLRLYMTSLDPMRGCTNQRYYIACPDGSLVIPPGDVFPDTKADGAQVAPKSGKDKVWRWTAETYRKNKDKIVVKAGRSSNVVDQDGGQTTWNVFTKSYLNDVIKNSTATPNSLIEDHINQKSSHELKRLGIPFPFAKPSSLFGYLAETVRVSDGDIVLDFFAGSSSTAHGILEYCVRNALTAKYIMVQFPEPIEEDKDLFKAGFKTISEASKERIRRVRKEIATDAEMKSDAVDLGFLSYKLAASNYKQWQNYHGDSVEELESLFDTHTSPLVDDCKTVEDGLFTEIMLLEGFPLDSTISTLSGYSENQIRRVECSFHENRLLVCLDNRIEQDTIHRLDLAESDTFICLDSAIDDETKTRLADKGLIKTI